MAAAATEAPLFRFGAIADVQFCDAPDGHSYDGYKRYYHNSLKCLARAVDDWNAQGDLLFVAQLGDLIDGKCIALGQRDEDFQATMKHFERCTVPHIVHCVGNHELYNFSREELAHRLGTVPSHGTCSTVRPTGKEFYSFLPFPGWRVLVLDPFQVAAIGWELDSAPYQQAVALLRANNPNDVFRDDVVWCAGLQGHAERWVPSNGALGAEQLAWMRSELTEAGRAGERVIVLSHVPLIDNIVYDTVWDYEEALAMLAEAGCVVAVFTGHTHYGGYKQDKAGIHHVVFPTPLSCGGDADLCHGHVEVFADRLEVVGKGLAQSYSLPFPVARDPSRGQE